MGVAVDVRVPRTASRPVGLLLVVGLLCSVSACSLYRDVPVRDETGAVTEEVETDAFAITTGDCIMDPGDGDIYELTVVPCTQTHDLETYAVTYLPDGEYPGEEAVLEASDAFCLDEFERFIGLKYEESVLDMYTFYPTDQTWTWKGDREVICLAGEYETASAPGSLKNAGR
ncbi:septum formation family protein [Arthrobacter sp. TMN-37]